MGMIDDVKTYDEKFIRDNDYTLRIERSGTNYEAGFYFNSRITRVFNFLAAQVTTTTRDVVYRDGGYTNGGGSSMGVTTTLQRFDEFQSDAEIRLMHAKLKELGGSPPEMDEPLDKKALRSPSVKGLNA
jgi:hypothetical protein